MGHAHRALNAQRRRRRPWGVVAGIVATLALLGGGWAYGLSDAPRASGSDHGMTTSR